MAELARDLPEVMERAIRTTAGLAWSAAPLQPDQFVSITDRCGKSHGLNDSGKSQVRWIPMPDPAGTEPDGRATGTKEAASLLGAHRRPCAKIESQNKCTLRCPGKARAAPPERQAGPIGSIVGVSAWRR